MTRRVPVIGGKLQKGSLRQDADRIETEVAPELQPDFIAQIAAHRAFHSGTHAAIC